MPMSVSKREFLLKVLGPERLEALERELPRMEQVLMSAGIGWKEIGPARPLGGATSWQAADAFQEGLEVLELADVFSMIISNVLDDAELDTEEKAALVAAAADDLEHRLTEATGEKQAGHSPAQPYIDLLGRRPAPATHDEEGEKAYSGDPLAAAAAPYIGDLIRQGAVL